MDCGAVHGLTILAFFASIFLIAALIAWLPDVGTRVVSIVTPVLPFLQVFLAAIGGWVGGLHPVNAFLVLFLFGWLFFRLRRSPAG